MKKRWELVHSNGEVVSSHWTRRAARRELEQWTIARFNMIQRRLRLNRVFAPMVDEPLPIPRYDVPVVRRVAR